MNNFNLYPAFRGVYSTKATILTIEDVKVETSMLVIKIRSAKKANDSKLAISLKNKSYYHIQTTDKLLRLSDDTTVNYYPYIVIDIDHTEDMDTMTLNTIINYFTTNTSTTYIEKSVSGKGLHIYMYVNKHLTHKQFRNLYLSITREILLAVNVEFGFIDTSLSRSVQPVFFSNDKVFANSNPTEFVVSRLLSDEAELEIYRTHNNTISLSFIRDVEEFVTSEKQIAKYRIKLDNKNRIIDDSVINGDDILILTKTEQLDVIKSLTKKTLSKDLIDRKNNGKTKHTFHKELLSTVFNLYSRKNLDEKYIIEYLESLCDDVTYRTELDKRIAAIKTYNWGNVKKTNAVRIHKNILLPSVVEVFKKEDTIQEKVDLYLKSDEKINSKTKTYSKRLFGDNIITEMDFLENNIFTNFNNKMMLIADTKTGKTYNTIEYYKTKGVVIFLTPTKKLRDELIEKYNGNLLKSNTSNLDKSFYVCTYDAFVLNEEVNTMTDINVLVDEVHTLVTEYYRHNIMNLLFTIILNNNYKNTVLMTATPLFDVPGYTKYVIRFDAIKKMKVNIVYTPFLKFVKTNLDTDKVNLVYINNVEEGIQNIYNYYKQDKKICKVLISDENESFLEQYHTDIQNPEFSILSTYLTTKVSEVGIGLDDYINCFFINPYSQNDIMSISSLEQLINRDNRLNKEGDVKNIYYYYNNKTVKLMKDGIDRIKDEFHNTEITTEYTNMLLNYFNSNYNCFKNELTTYSSIHNNRYLELNKELPKNITKDIKAVKTFKYKAMDWDKIRNDDKKASKYINDITSLGYNIERVNEWFSKCTYKEYKQILKLCILKAEYSVVDFDFNSKWSKNELVDIAKTYCELQLKEKDFLSVKTSKQVALDLLFISNNWRDSSTEVYTFKGLRNTPFEYDKILFKNDVGYSKEEIKQCCFDNNLDYKKELNNFVMYRQRVGGKQLQLYKLLNIS